MKENKEEKMDWENLEILLFNCFWRMFILVAVLRIVQTTPDFVEQFIVLMGLLWILHGFKITITGTLRDMKKRRTEKT